MGSTLVTSRTGWIGSLITAIAYSAVVLRILAWVFATGWIWLRAARAHG